MILEIRGLIQFLKNAILTAGLLVSANDAFAEETPVFPADSTIVVGSEIAYPPYCILDKNGDADGFSVELFKEAARHVNLDVKFVTGTWDSVKNLLRAGEIDALPLVGRTPERENYFDFTFPYLTLHGAIVVRKDNDDIFSLEDLSGKEVAVMKGDNAEEFMRRSDIDCDLITTPTFARAMYQLDNGKYDAVVMQKLLALQLIAQNDYKNLKIAGPPLKEFPQHFTFAVREGNSTLLSALNEGLSMVMTDGTFYRLRSKWFAPAFHKTIKERRIIVAGDHRYPPYDYLDENSQPAGFNTALTHAIAREMGLNIKVELMPWNEARQKLKEGKVDVIQGMYYSVERDNEFDLSPGYMQVRHVIVSRKKERKLQTLKDLKGKKIVVQKGDIMHDLALQNALDSNLITVESQDMAIKYVSEGKADAALVAQVQAVYWMKQMDIKNLRVAKNPVMTNDYCYSVKQGDQELLSIFSEGVSILKAKGDFYDIYNEYLGEYGERQYHRKEVIRYVIIVGLPLLIIALIIIFWNRILRSQVNKKTESLRKEIEERKTVENKLSLSYEQIAQQNEELQTLNEELTSSNEELGHSILKARESEEKFRNLAESTPTAIMLFQDENWVYANSAAQEMTGLSEEELVRQKFWDIVHPDFKEIIKAKGLERQEHEMGPGRYEICVIHKSGREVWVDLSAASITYKGQPAGIISASDISKRRQAEVDLKQLNKNLKKAKRKAEESDRLKSAFLLNISHEIRTPMNAIKGFSDILVSELEEEEHQRYLNIIRSNANQLLNVIDDVLLISRLQSEKMPLDEKEFLLDDFMNDLIDSHRSLLRDNIRIKKSISFDVRKLRAVADGDKLRRILSELIVNASKYTEKGTIEIGVNKTQENELQFYVADTGSGIEEKEKKHIFERFYRSESAQKKAIRGTGLGLSIVKYLTEFLNGKLTFDSQKAKGSVFRITVPVKFVDNIPLTRKNNENLKKGLESTAVLVVEDEPDNYLLIEALLSKHVKSMSHAPNGKSALNLMKSTKFDVVLLDLKLPDISGLNVMDLGKNIQPALPFIALTANAMPEDRAKALKAGCEAYITKPIDREKLFEILKKVSKSG